MAHLSQDPKSDKCLENPQKFLWFNVFGHHTWENYGNDRDHRDEPTVKYWGLDGIDGQKLWEITFQCSKCDDGFRRFGLTEDEIHDYGLTVPE